MNKKLLSFIAFTTVSFIGVGEFNDIKAKSFNNCSEAWSQGYGNIKEGEDGYSKRLDKDGDGRYYVGSDGAWIKDYNAKSGWSKEGEKWYYYKNGILLKNTWQGIYYLKSTGERASSEWIYDNQYKAWYYLKEDGSYAKNVWIGNYWLGSDGKMVTNSWVDNGRYYVGDNGAWVPKK